MGGRCEWDMAGGQSSAPAVALAHWHSHTLTQARGASRALRSHEDEHCNASRPTGSKKPDNTSLSTPSSDPASPQHVRLPSLFLIPPATPPMATPDDFRNRTLARLDTIRAHLQTSPRTYRLKHKVCIVTGVGSLKGIGSVLSFPPPLLS